MPRALLIAMTRAAKALSRRSSCPHQPVGPHHDRSLTVSQHCSTWAAGSPGPAQVPSDSWPAS